MYMVKRFLQYKTKHVSVILQKTNILPGRFDKQSLLVGSFMVFSCDSSSLLGMCLHMRKPTILVSDQIQHKPDCTVKEVG